MLRTIFSTFGSVTSAFIFPAVFAYIALLAAGASNTQSQLANQMVLLQLCSSNLSNPQCQAITNGTDLYIDLFSKQLYNTTKPDPKKLKDSTFPFNASKIWLIAGLSSAVVLAIVDMTVEIQIRKKEKEEKEQEKQKQQANPARV